MCMSGTPEVDDSESGLSTTSMVGNASCSLDKDCKCLCEDEIEINGVKSYRKSKMREKNQIVKKSLSVTG